MALKNGSVRSIKSVRSMKSNKSSISENIEPLVPTFEEVLPQTCTKYGCPFEVYVRREYQQDEFYQQLKKTEKPTKYKKITVKVPNGLSQVEMSQAETKTITTITSETSINEDAIMVTSFYDNVNNLTEIKLCKVRSIIPRSLIQIIGYLSASYDYLNKITLIKCRIDSIIIYELSKLLYTEYITDICLDGSPVREGNYYILLEHKNSRIKYLSLCACRINDEVCKEIAIRLHFMCPAEKTLLLLNLSSNFITDEGAKYLGEALRSNRRLRYLNLADNRIGDTGAMAILDTLMDFLLTNGENNARRSRLISYIRERNSLITQFLNECDNKSFDEQSRKSGKKKKTSATTLKNKGTFKRDTKKDPNNNYLGKAEQFAYEIMGPHNDPFDKNSIILKESCCYCLGNMVLCYLNLSYNKMGYLTVKKLLTVLQYQRIARKSNQTGLIKVVIEGNPMPTNCIEYQNLNDLFRSRNMQFGRLSITSQRKRSARISLVSQTLSGRMA